jgi:hypothetical protein
MRVENVMVAVYRLGICRTLYARITQPTGSQLTALPSVRH